MSRHRPRSRILMWIGALTCVGLISATVLVIFNQHAGPPIEPSRLLGPDTETQSHLRVGTIIILEPNTESCHRHQFDNITGKLVGYSLGPCLKPEADGVVRMEQRMNAIRETFSRR